MYKTRKNFYRTFVNEIIGDDIIQNHNTLEEAINYALDNTRIGTAAYVKIEDSTGKGLYKIIHDGIFKKEKSGNVSFMLRYTTTRQEYPDIKERLLNI